MIKARINIKPPSINAYFTTVIRSGKVLITISDRGKSYKDEVRFKVLPKLSRLEYSKKYFAGFVFGFSNAASDADNAVKPFQDAMIDAYNSKFGASLNDKQIYFPIAQKVVVKKGEEFIDFFIAPLELYAEMMQKISEKMENDDAFELFYKYITPQSL
jgi:Holliday junction resolvase RusA-like endonuclease